VAVNLTVHRNTVAKRRRRLAVENLESAVRHERKQGDMAGYALVTWDKDLKASASFWQSDGLTGALVPEFAKVQLLRKIGKVDAEHVVRKMFDIPDDSA